MSVTISVWLTLGSRNSDTFTDSELRISENFEEDSTGTITSSVPWSKVNGGTLTDMGNTNSQTALIIIKTNIDF